MRASRIRRLEPFARLLPRTAPTAVLSAAVAVWVFVFSRLVVWRQVRFGTPDHDLGIWDQAVWLLAHGQSFDTIRGLHVFGFHASPALYLYVPFYWLGAGPNLLNVSMAVSIGFGAVAVFRIAMHHLESQWQSVVLSLAFLTTYAGQWMVQETFHPEVMAITPLLFAYLAALEGRWRAFAAWLLLALMWKEDVALVGIAMGLLLAYRGDRTVAGVVPAPRSRTMGLRAAGLCALWFVIATRLVIPAFSPEGGFTDQLFGELGGSPTELASNLVTDPGLFGNQLVESEPRHYVRELTTPYGFTPLLAPLTLLMGLPQTLINLLAQYDFFWSTTVHYAALPLFASTVAAVEGIRRFQRPELRQALVGLVAVCASYTSVAWGVSPLSPKYDDGHWLLQPHADQELLEHAVSLPDADDAVSSYTWLVPQLTHREHIYTFPNPWLADNWGVHDENRHEPELVDWVMVNPSSLSERDAAVLRVALDDPGRMLDRAAVAALIDAAPGSDVRDAIDGIDERTWRVVVDQPQLLVVERVRSR